MNAMFPTSIAVRLAACALVKTRFFGRSSLTRQAERGSLIALAELEVALGLADVASVLQARRDSVTEHLQAMVRDVDVMDPRVVASRAAFGYLLAGDDYEAREREAARQYATGQSPTIAPLVAPKSCQAIDDLRAARKTLGNIEHAEAT